MKKPLAMLTAAVALGLLPMAVRAQNPPQPALPQHFYHVHFAVEELNGAGTVTNSRSYEETIATTGGGQPVGDQVIKTGSRIPILTGPAGSSPNAGGAQFQYIDLGVDLHVGDAREHGDMLGFRLKVDVSSIARQTNVEGTSEPVIRQNTWDSLVMVPVGKPTVVFSSDDLDSTGRMQVEVTATRIQ